jgi:LPS export ABC transporter protein LptC
MRKRQLLQKVLLTVVVAALAATVAVFVGYRRVSRNPALILTQLQKKADMQLNKISQTATKNGIREWRMQAESASLLKKRNTMLLVKPDVEFFMNDGENVHLTAEEGIIYTNSNRMDVSGEVRANTGQYRFRTDSLKYDPATRELSADTPVFLSGRSFTLRANRMAMDLTTNITRFEGDVEGTISEDLQL